MKKALYLGAAAALAVMVGFASGANAASVVIGGITVTDYGLVNPLAPNVVQPTAYSATGAQINLGNSNSGLDNNGWDPFGPSDTTHNWWNIGNAGGSVGFNRAASSSLTIVWGSPNDNNTVTFYSGANGTGSVVGAVTTPDLISAFHVVNADQPGYLINFASSTAFQSVVFSTDSTAFEFAAVPELSTWGMMLAGFAGLGLVGYGRKRKEAAVAA